MGAVLIRHPSHSPARRQLIERPATDPRWRWELTTPRPDEPFRFFLEHERG